MASNPAKLTKKRKLPGNNFLAREELKKSKRVNPHIPKVIPLKIFLDIAPSSSVDVKARCVDVLARFRKTMAGYVM